jgi:MFS family permease
MLGLSKWNLLCARMLCGIGTASGTVLMAEVCRTTTVEERTRFLSMCNAMFQSGIMIGPALQILLSYFNFNIFSLNVNTLNAPGMFLGVLWIIFFTVTIFLFENLTEEFRYIQEKKGHWSGGGKGQGLEPITDTVAMEGSIKMSEMGPKSEGNVSIAKMYMHEFLTKSFVLLMSLVFTVYFCQITFETAIPVITQDNFGFGVNENSFVYMAGGLEALMTFLIIALIGKRVRETTLQIVGWFLLVVAQVWLIIFMPNFEKGNQTHMVYFLLGICVIYLGSPIILMGNTALASKVLSNETQGLGQGIRRLISYVALVFGPTWAGWTVQTPFLFLGVTLALTLLNGVMLIISFKSLRKAEKKILESTT